MNIKQTKMEGILCLHAYSNVEVLGLATKHLIQNGIQNEGETGGACTRTYKHFSDKIDV